MSLTLTPAQKQAIADDGYLLVPRLVPPERVEAALTAINASLHAFPPGPAALERMRALTFCPELVAAPPIVDLYRETALASLAEAALGQGRVRRPEQAQIALRFPEPDEARGDPNPHIDGLPRPLNGVAAGTLYHFTALAAVFLSDVAAPFQGNFTVWPGTHRLMAAYFASHPGNEALLALGNAPFPPFALPPPRQLVVGAGDALLAHYQLIHGVAANRGPRTRYAIFFRLFHQAHDPASTAALIDPWREWEGLRPPSPITGA